LKERVIHCIKTALRLALRIVSVMITFVFFVLFYGVLGAIGIRGHVRHGDFNGIKCMVFSTEIIVLAAVLLMMLIPLYVYVFVEVSVNTVVKKLKLLRRFLVCLTRGIKGQARENDGETAQNINEQQKTLQTNEGFWAKIWTRYIDVIGVAGVKFETIIQEIEEERTKLNHADLKKEPEEKITNELSAETEETADAPAPRTRRKKKKRRSKRRNRIERAAVSGKLAAVDR